MNQLRLFSLTLCPKNTKQQQKQAALNASNKIQSTIVEAKGKTSFSQNPIYLYLYIYIYIYIYIYKNK